MMLRPKLLLNLSYAFGVTALIGAGIYWENLSPQVTVPTPVSPTVNARDHFLAAIVLRVRPKDAEDAFDTGRAASKKRTYTVAEKREIIAQNERALAILREGFAEPFTCLPERDGKSAGFTEWAKYRSMARLLLLESQVRTEQGDFAGAMSSQLDAMELGVVVPHGGAVIPQLVGIACEAIGRRHAWENVDRLSADDAQIAARRLEALTARRTPWVETLEEEKRVGQSQLLYLFQKYTLRESFYYLLAATYVDGEDSAKPGLWDTAKMTARLIGKSKRGVFSDYTAYNDAAIAQVRQPYRAVPPVTVPVPGDPINQILDVAFQQGAFKVATTATEDNLLTALLALQTYKARQGAYPVTLSNLVSSGILKRIPTDPFAGTNGTPFRYRRLANGRFLLYSVGPDGKDDGGRPINEIRFGKSRQRWMQTNDKGDWVAGVSGYTSGKENRR